MKFTHLLRTLLCCGLLHAPMCPCSDDECVSASSDGSCIIWDLTACRRRHSLFANTFFLSAVYHPDESQIVTSGTDRKVGELRLGGCEGVGAVSRGEIAVPTACTPVCAAGNNAQGHL